MDNELNKTGHNNDTENDAAEAIAELTDLTEISTEGAEEALDLTEFAVDTTEVAETAAGTVAGTDAENAAEAAAVTQESTAESTEGKAETAAAEKSKDKYRFDILSKLIIWVVTAFLFLGAVFTTGYYVTTTSRGEFHADCTDTIMWANASAESGHLYDKDFSYACFLPFGTNTIMRPLLHFYGLSMKTHIIGMTCFFILLTLFMVLLMREVTGNLPISLAGTALFLALTLSTAKMREIFWGHTIYYTLGILFLVIGSYLYSRVLAHNVKAKNLRKNGKSSKVRTIRELIVFGILCIFMLLTGMDGITGITLFTIPLVCAIIAEQFVNNKQKLIGAKTGIVASRAAILFIMAFIGVKINDSCLGDLTAGYQDANSTFSDMNTWIDHIHNLPLAWMKLLGVENMPNTMFTKDGGIPNIIFIMASIIIAVMPIIATCCYKLYSNDRRGRMMRIWVWIHWAVTAVNLMGYVFGVLSAADWRIIPMIGTAMILSILFVCWAVSTQADQARICFLLLVPVISAGFMSCQTVNKMPKDNYKKNTQYILSDFLKEEGVTKGYSTFWNANSITVISGETIKVRDVEVDENGVRSRHYQSSKRWYVDDPLQSEYFLLVSSYEYDLLEKSEFFKTVQPVRTAETVANGINYTLLVYDHNIV
ncbi:MAG: hypothetical protein J6X56_10195 [Ruminococcus sp.]|nr:hypothetical protein [Ruminococcus sp.]